MRIYLREIKEDDAKLIVKWRNNANVASHCFTKTVVTEESHNKFYNDFVKTGKYLQFIVERVEESVGVASYPIATVYLKDIDKNNKRCELCIFTSDDEEWNTESQSIAIKMLVDKAFDELGMHKIYSYVFAANENEVKLLENSGLRKEALLKEEAIDMHENYADVYRMSIFRGEQSE